MCFRNFHILFIISKKSMLKPKNTKNVILLIIFSAFWGIFHYFLKKSIKHQNFLFSFRKFHILWWIPQKCTIRPPKSKIGFLCLCLGPSGHLWISKTQNFPDQIYSFKYFSIRTCPNYLGRPLPLLSSDLTFFEKLRCRDRTIAIGQLP